MTDFFPIYIYFVLCFAVALLTLGASLLFRDKKSSGVKYMPYESGIQTEAHLLKKRFSLRHYLVGLLFLVFDIEVIFLYPWAAIAKQIGPFAFYEMLFFLAAILVGFAYVWKKGGLNWE
ncbi:MAG TPA: NADH-quinone oxidoreductase subunit A [Parachlamydiaceae bacterium]|nr:NADH-quinone oxidoreductase subunit A [Parachlamydiaceae bacterium]